MQCLVDGLGIACLGIGHVGCRVDGCRLARMSINSVALDAGRDPLPINSLERVNFRREHVQLLVRTGTGYPGCGESYGGDGIVTCTSNRMIFVTMPQLPRFDSFMVTWNRIARGKLHHPKWWNIFFRSAFVYETLVHPVEGEIALRGPARLYLLFRRAEDGAAFADCLDASRWTGNIDPEASLEPPPPYGRSVARRRTPPPAYGDLGFAKTN